MFAHVHRETAVARAARAVFIHAAVCVALGHGAAFAQTGSIAGLVRDTSGAVLPGGTVDAARPVLIEKARPVTTDGQGIAGALGPLRRERHRPARGRP